ncbi:MAG: peptidylprolyl isomerase [Pirellulales bacterium]
MGTVKKHLCWMSVVDDRKSDLLIAVVAQASLLLFAVNGVAQNPAGSRTAEVTHRTTPAAAARSANPAAGDWIFGPGAPAGQATSWQQRISEPTGAALGSRPVGGPPGGRQLPAQFLPNAVSSGPPTFPPPTAQSATATTRPVEAAEIVAWVGDEFILAGEVLGTVNRILKDNRDRIPESMWDTQRRILMQQALKGLIENKLVLVDAKSNIPEDALPGIEQRVNKSFEENYVVRLMERLKVTSRGDLEKKLVASGSSLTRQRRIYFERSLAAYWVGEKTRDDSEISSAELYDYYRQHVAEFEHQGEVNWEQLTARFQKYPAKQDAYRAIADMGNDVLVRRIPFAAVAKAKSNGVTAGDGGRQDWTTQGSLKSKILDRALFTVPEGVLSDIIEADDAFHIVRISERRLAHVTPFRDAQVEIGEKIRKQRKNEATKKFFASLRKEVRVWTIFDATASQGRPPQF